MNALLDDVAVNLGTRTSRRSVFALLAGGILGVSVAAAPADAARRSRNTRSTAKGKRAAKQASSCPTSRQCGSTCCTGKMLCVDASQGICAAEGQMVGS